MRVYKAKTLHNNGRNDCRYTGSPQFAPLYSILILLMIHPQLILRVTRQSIEKSEPTIKLQYKYEFSCSSLVFGLLYSLINLYYFFQFFTFFSSDGNGKSRKFSVKVESNDVLILSKSCGIEEPSPKSLHE